MRRTLIGCVRWLVLVLACLSTTAIAQEMKPPETFMATARATAQDGGAVATLRIQIDKYTDERDRTKMAEALKTGGYPAFLPALRGAPEVGYVEMNGRKVAVRWARQQATAKGRAISIVTESPLFFVGGGGVDAKPRAGYEVAILQFDVDTIGMGTGSMAAAARVRPGGETGVQIDDYAAKPVILDTVRKSYK